MPTYQDTEVMRLGLLADQAILQLREKVQFLKNFGRGWDLQSGQKDNEYYVNKIDDGGLTVRERLTDSASVTDDETAKSKISITTKELYISQPFYRQFNDTSTAMKHYKDFINTAVGKIAAGVGGVENRAIKEITRQAAPVNGAASPVRILGQSGTTVSFANFQAAKLLLNNSNVRDELSFLSSNEQMQNALGLTEFKNYNVNGVGGGSNVSGEAETTLYGFMPQSSNLMRDGNPVAITTLALNGAIADAVATTVNFDGQVPTLDGVTYPITDPDEDKALRAGQVILIETEYMLVTTVTYASNATGAATVIRGWWGSTAAAHADPNAISRVNSKATLYYKGADIISAFARQKELNELGQIKVTAADPDNSMFLSILKEGIAGKNGAHRVVVSIDIGFKILRAESVILAVFPL